MSEGNFYLPKDEKRQRLIRMSESELLKEDPEIWNKFDASEAIKKAASSKR
jgi:hypothetical protein